jgi:hypothetical protein
MTPPALPCSILPSGTLPFPCSLEDLAAEIDLGDPTAVNLRCLPNLEPPALGCSFCAMHSGLFEP